jgi:AcrR family transcriptional regulator
MVIRQRAIQAAEKEERREAILAAAERLLARAPARMASVAEVADEAGLAKGTVYLYFPSKEELLLAVHERSLERFFAALNTLLDRPQPVVLDDLLAVTSTYVVRPPLFLPLAGRCLALMAQSIPAAAAAAFRQRMAARLERAGAGLERRFAALRPGEGAAKLRQSFAMIIGLWQMATASACSAPSEPGVASSTTLVWSYPEELVRALTGLWQFAASVPPGPLG